MIAEQIISSVLMFAGIIMYLIGMCTGFINIIARDEEGVKQSARDAGIGLVLAVACAHWLLHIG